MITLDYSIESPQERNELVKRILEENPEPSESYLEVLTNYLVLPMEKQERKEHKLLTDNRMLTINKRETSYEGLVSQFENGEDGVYNLVNVNSNKNIIFQPKISITKKDLEEIEPLKQIKEAIAWWESKSKTATGHNAYIIKKAIIELRKEQYIVKNFYRQPIVFSRVEHSKHLPCFDDSFSFDSDGYVIPKGISFCDPKVISAILCNYSRLKEAGWGDFESDMWYMMYDFDVLIDKALKNYPMYDRICQDKIDNMQNINIQQDLREQFGVTHSLEYISSLWRKKIPNIVASYAEDEILNWYYLVKKKGKYKKCSRCGKIKLAHSKYFSKNKTSKDHFYSICKECRNSKNKNIKGQ